MRKVVKDYLIRTLTTSLLGAGFRHNKVIDEKTPVDVCFDIYEERSCSFFLHVVCSDESDSMQVNLVWNREGGYPASPSSLDLSLPHTEGVSRLLRSNAVEIPLASLDESVPWLWNLDAQYGTWKSKLDALMANASSGKVDEHQFSAHLLSMPKKCPTAEAKASADKFAKQIVAVLKQQKSILTLIANGAQM